MDKRMVWVDLETTGLDPRADVILEVAVAIADSDTLRVSNSIEFVVTPDHPFRMERMDTFVRNMHLESGLIADIDSGHGLNPWVAQHNIINFFKDHHIEPGVHALCGSSVQFDRLFLEQHMPSVAAHFHYRNMDVSTIKELVRRWYPDVYDALRRMQDGRPKHRALGDIGMSIAELQFYRERIFTRVVS